MNLSKCMENLKADIGNGGIVEDSFAAICYVTMANTACRMMKNASTQKEIADAKAYISLCHTSGVDSLVNITEI